MEKAQHGRMYSYKDIQQWEGNWELIDGVPYLLASPSYIHQYVVGELHLALAPYFKARGCRLILSPFDVQFDTDNDEEEAQTVVQPDLFVICNVNQLKKNRVQGAPDLVIEVLSASTGIKDRNQKYYLYETNGVKEYWMVDPSNRTIEVIGLEDGRFQKRAVFGPKDVLTSFLYPDLAISLNSILHMDDVE